MPFIRIIVGYAHPVAACDSMYRHFHLVRDIDARSFVRSHSATTKDLNAQGGVLAEGIEIVG